MGFMGMSCICDSDMASDSASAVTDEMVGALRKQANKAGNSCNTPGYINVALYFKEIICPCKSQYFYTNEKLRQLAKELVSALEIAKSSFKDDEDLKKDIEDMISALTSFLKKDTLAEENRPKKK